MSTAQNIEGATPRIGIRGGKVLAALGALVAIATTIAILALTSANNTTVASAVAPSQAVGASTPQIHYLGPRQMHGGGIATAGSVGASASHYTCLGADQRCRR